MATDTLEIFGDEYTGVTGFKATDDNGNTKTYIRPQGTKSIAISANGTTTEDVTNYASAQITASVPNTYASGDEGKVVSNGALVSQTSDIVTQNGTVDTTLINSLTVSVSGGGSALSPILNSSVTIGGSNAGSIEITLPKTVTNCIVSVQADSTTFSAMYDDTNTGYNFLSGVFLYPFPSYQNGESTIYTCKALNRYRTSYKTTNYYYISNITISGTTLTVSVDSTCRFRANGTYLVKVWEVALT